MNASIGKIGVIYGGWSNERDISVKSGISVINSYKNMGFAVVGFDLKSFDDILAINKNDIDVFLLALHGGDGEDGHIQSYLDMIGAKYIGSGVLASALCMDKVSSRLICSAVGVNVVPWQDFSWDSPPKILDFDFPLCLKPVAGGSSLGVRKILDVQSWELAISSLSSGRWMVEPWLSGTDHFVGMLGEIVLPVLEVSLPDGEFFDYANKYSDSQEVIYSVVEHKSVQDATKKAFRGLQCKHYARADFITVDGQSYFLEMNTLPGMSSNSLLPMQAKAFGLSYEEFLYKIISN